MVNGPGPGPGFCTIQAFQLTCWRVLQCPGEVRICTECTAFPVFITTRASQYRDEPVLTMNESGPVSYHTIADSGAIRANAVALRSMWPAAHSGHWSTTLTRTDPSGPVTSR